MNLTGAALGGMVNQANTQQDQAIKLGMLGVNRSQAQLALMKMAGDRMTATQQQITSLVSQLPSRAYLPKIQGTLNNLINQHVQLAKYAGFDPQTIQSEDMALVQSTPTIDEANALAHNQAAQKNVTPTTIRPGGSAIQPGTIPGTGPVPVPSLGFGPPPAAPGASFTPSNGGASVGPLTSVGSGGGTGAASSAPGGGLIRNAAGGFTNTNAAEGQTTVNIAQPKAYNENTGKMISDFIGEQQKGLGGYQDSLNQIGQLRKSLTEIPTGGATVTGAAANLQKFTQRFGIDLSQFLPKGLDVDPTKYDIANKAITQLAAAFARSNFPTRITNNDMTIAIAATPNFGNTVDANKELLNNLESVARIRLAEAKFMRQRASQITKAGGTPDWTIIDDWTTALQQMKGISPALKSAFADNDATLPSGVGTPTAAPAQAKPTIDPQAALQELRRRGAIQ